MVNKTGFNKAGLRTAACLTAALLMVAGLQGALKAVDDDAEIIYVVDSLKYDGSAIDITYTVNSTCGASQHQGAIDFEPDTKKMARSEKLVGLKAVVYDIVQSPNCRKGTKPVTVSMSLDFQEQLKDAVQKLDEDGYDVSGNYYIELPRTYASEGAPSKKPTVWEDKTKTKSQIPGRRDDTADAPTTRRSSIKQTINVTKIDYSLKWHCNLDKHSPAKRNNFDGYGATEAEARRQAGSGCAVTNAVNPNCSEMAISPKYTTCDVNLEEKSSVVQVADGVVPAGAALQGWTCALNKNDGARRDGFTGEGATMEEAQAAAAKNCGSDGNPLCGEYALDGDHTSCGASYVLNAVKPVLNWTCVLDKHSPAKRNTFYGTGATEAEARRRAGSGCAVTNAVNPNCSEMALNPSYTTCNVEIK